MVRSSNGGSDEPTMLLRVPGAVARALPVQPSTAGRLLLPLPIGVADPSTSPGREVEVLPVRSRFVEERCRACGRCVDVCPFGALSLGASGDGNSRQSVHIEAALCRGCGLCSAVCPTGTAVQSALSAEWWADRIDTALSAQSQDSKRDAYLVIACQRRAGAFEKTFEDSGVRVDIIRVRCAGQLDAGMLLELYAQPFRGVLVAGCLTDRCRFTKGSRLGGGQLARAESILSSMGHDVRRLRADWSPDRAGDLLDGAVARLIAETTAGIATDGGGH